MNHLYFADCLDVLKELYAEHNGNGFIDLIYIDPPFNSKRNYNVLFESIDMKDATAQKQAFADTWSNYEYKDTIRELAELDKDLFTFLETLDKLRTSDSSVAYLATMSIRIWYMHKLLKDTGSFYLHCDPTMSSYLRIICDLVFGERSFRNEIIWKRRTGSNSSVHNSKEFGNTADVLWFYTKGEKWTFHGQYSEGDESYKAYLEKSFFKVDESGRRYMSDNLANPAPRPNLMYDYKGYKHPKNGWAISKEKMEQWDKEGRLIFPSDKNGRIRRKRYLDEVKGKPVQNIWDDIQPISSQSDEGLGFPTQKPEILLERILNASTNENDLVADFFCGCGTTIAAAQKLNRQWLGSDISHLAIRLISKRLVDTYGIGIRHTFDIKGFPKDIGSARELAEGKGGRFDFQEWVIEVLLNGIINPKKSADGGWDGYITFTNEEDKKEFIIIEVKSGNINVKNLREFENVVQREKAAMGIFVCFDEQVTGPMRKLGKESGFYREQVFHSVYPKIQILTVEDLLLHHKEVKMPKFEKTTFKKAQRSKDENKTSKGLFD